MTLDIKIWQTQNLADCSQKIQKYLKGQNFGIHKVLLNASKKKAKAKSWMGYCGFEWSNTTLSLEEIPTCPMSLFWKYLNPLWGGGNGSQDLAKFWQRIKNTMSNLKDTDHNICLDWANDIMMVVWIEIMRLWWLLKLSEWDPEVFGLSKWDHDGWREKAHWRFC